MIALLVFAVLLGGFAVEHQRAKRRSISQTARGVTAPFEMQFDEQGIGRGLRPRILHPYDPSLPGYRIEAAIATLRIRPRQHQTTGQTTHPKSPDKLVLAIRTSSPSRPMLESFALIAPDVTVQ